MTTTITARVDADKKRQAEEIFDDIADRPDPSTAKVTMARIVAFDAFRSAIPHLDIILTPNGFGIVNNSNIAPASKERIERLMVIVEKQRDDTFELYLKYTNMYNSQWTSTRQGRYFTATLFPNINLCDRCGITEHQWERYKQLREQLVLIETKLANEFFSPEQMSSILIIWLI